MTYHVGFTGSRQGMSLEQKATLEIAFNDIFQDPDIAALHGEYRFHHGDCVGADAEAHDVWRSMFLADPQDGPITIHPPLDPRYRAFKRGDEVLDPKGYLERDDDIVAGSHYLIGTPNTMKPKRRGGTWYTIRQAASTNIPGSVILPDGMVVPVSDYA